MEKYAEKLRAAQKNGELLEFPEGSREFDLIARFGFLIHYVSDASSGHVDIHTHGVNAIFGSPELRLVLPLEMEAATSIFHILVNECKQGRVLAPGIINGLLRENMPILLAADTDESGEYLLRIILPDPSGSIDKAAMDPRFAEQFHGLPESNPGPGQDNGPTMH